MKRIKIFTGNFGSGKTEISINYSLKREKPPFLLDLDIVKPYFRLREAEEILTEKGVEVIFPEGALSQADLPIVVPQVYKALQDKEREVIIDVGGDDDGARVLGSLHQYLKPGNYEFLMVVNIFRPFSSRLEDIFALRQIIEAASRLEVTHLVANPNLGPDTAPENVEKGFATISGWAEELGLPIKFTAILEDLVSQVDIPGEILPVNLHVQPPWNKGGGLL